MTLDSAIKRCKRLYVLYFAGVGAQSPFLNLYLSKGLGLSTGLIGSVTGLSSIVSILIQPIWCKTADNRGKGPILSGVFFLTAIAALLYSRVRSAALLFPVACLFTLASCSIVPILDSITLDCLKRSPSGPTYSKVRLWGSIGYVIAAAAAGALYFKLNSLHPLFFVYALLLAAAAVQTLASGTDASKASSGLVAITEAKSGEKGKNALASLLAMAPTRFLLLGCFLHQLATGTGMAYLGIFSSQIGGSYLQVGLMNAIGAVVEVPTGLLLGRFTKRWGAEAILAFSFGLNAIRWFLVSITHSPAVLYALQCLGGIIFISFYSSAVSLIDRYTPEKLKSSGQSVFWVCTYGLSSLIGTPIGGWLYDRAGSSAFYVAVGLVSSAATIIWAFLGRRQGGGNLMAKTYPDIAG